MAGMAFAVPHLLCAVCVESKCAQLVQDCETIGLINSVLQMIMEEYSGKLDVSAPARGILASKESFTFLFGIMLGEDFFTIIDHLSRALQKESLSAFEAKAYAAVTVSTMMEKRSDDYFERFWDKVTTRAHQLGVKELALTRKRRAPSRVDKKCNDKFPRRNSQEILSETLL